MALDDRGAINFSAGQFERCEVAMEDTKGGPARVLPMCFAYVELEFMFGC